MKTNHKFTIILIVMLTTLLIATLLNVAINFRAHALHSAGDKARMTASIVKDGLTAHMVSGTMDQRQYFLDSIAHADNVEKLWIIRAPAVDEQFGKGLLNEFVRDKIDDDVLKTGEVRQKIVENSNGVYLRVTIPYTASVDGSPNCLSCHNVENGTVLGAVSMELDISETRNTGALTLLKILGLNIIFIIIAIIITNRFLKPFIKHFEDLREGVKLAYKGDFSYKFDTTLKGEGAEVTEQLNHLFHKMEETFGEIKHNLTTFLSQSRLSHDDPLREAQMIIKELSDVYKFKNTIELDATKEDIFERIIYIIENKYNIKEFTLFKINKTKDTRNLIYSSALNSNCVEPLESLLECRAYRTNSDVVSTDFPDLCKFCSKSEVEYLCIAFTINDNVTLTLTIYAKDAVELEDAHDKINSIKNYLSAAKPVIESRILMDQLRDSSLRDGMTGLYNRRFLEEFIDKVMKQTLRDGGSYTVLMIDIDYFKLVNDSYGHDAGDVVIKGLSRILQDSIRAADLAIRYGGEEFLVLLHNAQSKGAVEVAHKIKASFNDTKFNVGTETIQKTLSIGLANFPSDADAIWKVIKYADTALYEAKNTGRNKVVVFKPEMFSYEDEKSES
jgi:two-component system, cell cycle response regulator